MRKTVVTHFFNEEYLLPWWLGHHKKYFDHGVMIDYNSTDSSAEIIKKICPTWTIVKSRNEYFDAKLCDDEVIDYESQYPGWKMCLNVTEFLVGDYSILDNATSDNLILPCCVMVDNKPEIIPDPNKPLIEQKTFGMHYNDGASKIRRSRVIHSKRLYVYPLGRHFDTPHTTEKLVVLWYGFSPYNTDAVKRKLQIQTKIPPSDFAKGYGTQHNTNEEKLNAIYQDYLSHSKELGQEPFMVLNNA